MPQFLYLKIKDLNAAWRPNTPKITSVLVVSNRLIIIDIILFQDVLMGVVQLGNTVPMYIIMVLMIRNRVAYGDVFLQATVVHLIATVKSFVILLRILVKVKHFNN